MEKAKHARVSVIPRLQYPPEGDKVEKGTPPGRKSCSEGRPKKIISSPLAYRVIKKTKKRSIEEYTFRKEGTAEECWGRALRRRIFSSEEETRLGREFEGIFEGRRVRRITPLQWISGPSRDG